MNLNKFAIFCVEFLLILIGAQFAVSAYSTGINVDRLLTAASTFTWISFLIEIALWRKISGEWFSPYTVFYLVLFLFCCGQSVGWSLGLDMGEQDMLYHGYSFMNNKTLDPLILLKGMCFSCLGKSCFHLGALIFYRDDLYLKNARRYAPSDVIATYRKLGKLMLFIVVPAFIVQSLRLMLAVQRGGYLAYYDEVGRDASKVVILMDYISNLYLPSLLILLIGYRDSASLRKLIISLMLVDVLIELFIGGRSNAAMALLAVALVYRYFVGPFTKKQIVLGGAFGYVFLALLNFIATTRSNAGRTFGELFLGIFDSFKNVLGTALGELGGTLSSICFTMMLAPSQYSFRYGMSYWVAPLTWVPAFFFPGEHPCVTWGALSAWLTRALNASYGVGYTMFAEAYINFGWYGLIALCVEGAALVRIIARVSQLRANQDIIGSTFQIMVIMIVMKHLTRSSLVTALRFAIFGVLPMYLLVRIVLNSVRKNATTEGGY